MKKTATTLHVDINSYFATIIQQENPHLREKPVGIIKDEGRTCLIATSKEAKKLGIGTGTYTFQAKKICKDIILIPASFERYLDATKRLQKVFKEISPNIFIYSLDEAFIDISDCQKYLYQDTQILCQNIQQNIKNELGEWVTSNVGIGPNRLLAKIASEISPKGSILEINDENKDAILAKISFKDVCGIGYRLSKKLEKMNITVPYQIRFFSQEQLEVIFGPFWSKELLKIAYGEEPHLLKLLDKENPHMKSVGRSITGYKLCDNESEIKSILFNLCMEIVDKTRKMNLAGRNVWIGLYGQNQAWSKHITLPHAFNHGHELLFWVQKLYNHWDKSFKIIKFAVRLSLLKPNNQAQLLPSWKKQEAIQTALDKINEKFGIFTLYPASINKNILIKPEVKGFLGDRKYQLG